MTNFICFLAIKLVTEYLARISEGWYLTGSQMKAAIGTSLVVAASIPIGRMIIGKNDNYVAAAVVIAAGVTTYFGSLDYARRVKREDNHRRTTRPEPRRRALRAAPSLRNHRGSIRRSKGR